jgi:hypothetical protein
MAKVNFPPPASLALGLNIYAFETVALVAGVPEMLGGGGAAAASTMMLKAGREALCAPSLTLITIGLELPTSDAAGVPLSLPVFVSNAAHEGLPVMANVSLLALASEALGWNVYANPTTAWVLGVPEMVGGVGGVSTPTEMAKAGSDAVSCPLFTLMTMPESEPTSAAPGVPASWPVFSLNVAQDGLFVIEKVSAVPEAPEVLG